MLGVGAHAALGRARACPTARSTSRSTVRPARASARSCRGASRCGSKATPTTTSARACRAARIVLRPPRDVDVRRRGERHRGQRDPLRRDRRRRVHPRHGGRAVLRAQLRRDRGGRGRRRPRLRVHDRRPRGDPRSDRVATSRPGMSGGFAFVCDPDQSLFRRMNRDMVDLDPLDDEDVDWLRGIITQHLEVTGSEVAERLLSSWWQQRRLVREGVPEGLQAGARGPARRRSSAASTPTRRSWRRLRG